MEATIINTINSPWIKLKQSLDNEDYKLLKMLQEHCMCADNITLKLELDYKLGAGIDRIESIQDINEFMYFIGQKLVGYIGISCFGGKGSSLEITGMVHPDYRRQGIYTILHELAMAECRRRNIDRVLLLCDRGSTSGQGFLEKIGALYKSSEFEMYLQQNCPTSTEEQMCGITFRKASNSDAFEVARQNAIYFGDVDKNYQSDSIENDSGILLPEDEEKRGMTIYIAERDNQIIGKAHLEINNNSAVGGIYGLGVLPKYRGNGYGRAILLRAIEKLKATKVKEIMLQVSAENAAALRLYKSCGFQETSIMDYFELKL